MGHTMDPEVSATSAEATPASIHSAPAGGGRAVSPTGIEARCRLPLWTITLGVGIVSGVLAGLAGEATNRAIPLIIQYPPNFESVRPGYQRDAVLATLVGNA